MEFFGANSTSFQLQVGYIFPRYNAPLQQMMEMQGEEGMATNEGIFSYRTSPYNNYGVSTKIEFRKYGKRNYYAFQMMYKYCFYDYLTYELHGGGMAYNQTESKDSNICGMGFMLGRQSEEARVVTDWYFGGGLRFRTINIVVHELAPVGRPIGPVYPDKKEYITSIYPFVNLGLRIGYRFGRK